MHGTERQLESIKNDTYNTEFATVGELIDRVNEFEPLFGSLYGNVDIKTALHGFTHMGKQQLIRMATLAAGTRKVLLHHDFFAHFPKSFGR